MAWNLSDRVQGERGRLEWAVAGILAVITGFLIVSLSDLSTKYQVAAVAGVAGVGFLVLSPERRIWCLIQWILIMPLSIEKVFYVAPPIWHGFTEQSITINAADGLLALLLVFLAVKQVLSGERNIYWSPFATIFAAYLGWAIISLIIHVFIFNDGLASTAPLSLLHLLKMLLFIVLIHSAVRSRGDAILALAAVLFIVFFESIIVGLSYATHEILNFTRFIGGQPQLNLQTYGSQSSDMVRGDGTLGQTNQTATFETFYALAIVGFFGLRNSLFRFLAVIVLAAASLAIVLTFSRAAWISYALAVIVMTFLFLKARAVSKSAWLTGAGIAIVAVVAIGALSGPIMDRLTRQGDEGATASRLRMIDVALDLAKAYPIIGVGPGEYAEAGLQLQSPAFQTPQWVSIGQKPTSPLVGRLDTVTFQEPGYPSFKQPLSVHNRFLLCLSELGVVGLCLWLLLYWAFLRDALLCFRSVDPFYRAVGIAGIGYIVAAVTYMNLDLFNDDKSIEILFFVPVLISAVARCARSKAPEG